MNIVARLIAFALAVFLPAEEATAKNKAWSAVGFTVENTRWVDVDPQVAWRAFVEDVDKWWPDEFGTCDRASASSLPPGAEDGLPRRDDKRDGARMDVLFVEPGKRMRMSDDHGLLHGVGPHGALEWRFAEENGGTRITLQYGVEDVMPDDISELATAVDEVQAGRLEGLASYLRARRGSES